MPEQICYGLGSLTGETAYFLVNVIVDGEVILVETPTDLKKSFLSKSKGNVDYIFTADEYNICLLTELGVNCEKSNYYLVTKK
jgi:C4-dicarboxylate-specific signal transduction histidine kinase